MAKTDLFAVKVYPENLSKNTLAAGEENTLLAYNCAILCTVVYNSVLCTIFERHSFEVLSIVELIVSSVTVSSSLET